MKDLKLTLYDWLGYLIPGSILIISINLVLENKEILAMLNITTIVDFKFVEGLVFFFFAYFIGHIMHVVANHTIDKLPYGDYAPKEYFENKFKDDFSPAHIKAIKDILKEKFQLDAGDNEEHELKKNYWFCVSYVLNKNSDSLSKTFLNLNGLYRGLTVSTFIASVIFMIKSIVDQNSLFFYLSFIGLLCSILLYERAKRFKIYLTRAVYFEFLALNIKADDKTDNITNHYSIM